MVTARQQNIGVREATPREINGVFQRLWADLAKLQGQVTVVTQLTANSAAGGLVSTVAQLQEELRQMREQIAALQARFDSSRVSMRLDVATAAGVPVYPTGTDTVSPVDPSDPLTVNAVIGLTEAAGAAGAIVVVRRYGTMSVSGVSLEPGRAVYAAVGGVTQSPSYEAYAVPLGVAVTSSALFVQPELALLVSEDLYGSPFDDFTPVTWGLLRRKLGPMLGLLDLPDGFLVKAGDTLTTRVFVTSSGGGISIENNDGIDGDPIFTVP
jgi:uncharacterized coiled-coil protein SlyX